MAPFEKHGAVITPAEKIYLAALFPVTVFALPFLLDTTGVEFERSMLVSMIGLVGGLNAWPLKRRVQRATVIRQG